MNAETILPRRLVVYIHDVGVKALDHLADNVKGAESHQTPRQSAPKECKTNGPKQR